MTSIDSTFKPIFSLRGKIIRARSGIFKHELQIFPRMSTCVLCGIWSIAMFFNARERHTPQHRLRNAPSHCVRRIRTGTFC